MKRHKWINGEITILTPISLSKQKLLILISKSLELGLVPFNRADVIEFVRRLLIKKEVEGDILPAAETIFNTYFKDYKEK